MIAVISWYLVISIAGWLVFPIIYRLLPGLAERGYAFARVIGLLLWGYLFWLLASLGLVRNNLGGLLLPLVILAAGSLVLLLRDREKNLLAWLRPQAGLIVSVEIVFLLSFTGMALIRGANPEILGTEKPMELAFINAVLHSPTFPPHDPWLSGYAISYYYFGYVIVAMLAKLTGTSGGVAFNLGITTAFALSAAGAYGLVYSLLGISPLATRAEATLSTRRARWLSILGPVFVLLVSNAEGFLQVLHTRGLFWRTDASGQLVSPFWKWLDILDLNQPPAQPFSWIPTRFWWWWRASRVIQDYDFSGGPREIINEFPVFSYLLADLHPHVLAMPFAFLGMALALNLFLSVHPERLGWLRWRLSFRGQAWLAALSVAAGIVCLWLGLSDLSLRMTVVGVTGMLLGGLIFIRIPAETRRHGLRLWTASDLGEAEIGPSLYIDGPSFLLYALVLGGLAFLNTWDFPIYLVLFAGAYLLRRTYLEKTEENRRASDYLSDLLTPMLTLGVASVLLYLPFYLGFASQAGGVIPNLIYPTRGAQLWVMFATLLLPILAYLFYLWKVSGSRAQLRKGFALSIGLFLLLWALSWLFALLILLLPGVKDLFLSSLAATGGAELFMESLIRRFSSPGGWITALALLGLGTGLLVPARKPHQGGRAEFSPAHIFTILITLLATLLVLGAEFFFLRDQFGWRINTIFKFYYQAWLMWGIAAAFGSAVLLVQLPRIWGGVFRVGLGIILFVGLTYTLLGLWSKTNGFQPPAGWSLDGTDYYARQSPDDMAAIRWLSAASPGVVAEAVGGSYSEYARVATLSGQPNVLGWPGHESQWRGGAEEMGSRQADLARLYCTRSWEEARAILEQYGIRYVYVGDLERLTYTPEPGSCPSGLFESKFSQHLTPVYQAGGVSIYEVPDQ